MLNQIRKSIALFSTILLFCATAALAQKPDSADNVLDAAKKDAAQQHKQIFLIFGASWCGPCRELNTFLEDPQTGPIVNKYFVVAKLSVAEEHGKYPDRNSPGGEELMEKLDQHTAAMNEGIPFIVFMDAAANPLTVSELPIEGKSRGAGIGYPERPEEIAWFMQMWKTAVPSLTPEESTTIEEWLKAVAAAKKKK